jgi:DNA adenine methylase
MIENQPASAVIAAHDSASTLIYADPPYPRHTRGNRFEHSYRYEFSDDDHRVLASVLHAVRSMVVISGYPCPLYDGELYQGWERHERKTFADGGRERTEVLWLNPAASAARRRAHPELWDALESGS